MKTIAEMLRWRARLDPDGIALTHGGRSTTYAELDRRSSRVASALVAAGLQPGERVCLLDKGHDEFIEVLFGVAKAGGVYTPVNWRLVGPEIAFVLNDAEAPIVFVGEFFADMLAGIESELGKVRKIVRWGDGPDGWEPYQAFRDGASDDDPERDSDPTATAWQLYTSGTTGRPKGAELTHLNMFETANLGTLGFGPVSPGDTALICLPFFHVGGSGYALAAFFAGARLLIARDADPGEILRLITEEGVNHALFVPALINFLLQHPDCEKTDFSSMRSILYGASPIPAELLTAALERIDCRFIQIYGLTETSGAVVLLPASDHAPGSPRLASCGLPVYGQRVRVVDAEGRDCAPGTVGEVIVKGPMVMKGYYNQPEASAEAIRDGWFHSGDAGYLDEDGYLYIHDRVKDMIVSGGENIYPAEVESALFAHEAVADVAVIGVPDERWGESVKAMVVRAPGADADEQTLIDFCKARIAGYKIPNSVDFVAELPRNATGKILKRELRAPYWVGHERQVH